MSVETTYTGEMSPLLANKGNSSRNRDGHRYIRVLAVMTSVCLLFFWSVSLYCFRPGKDDISLSNHCAPKSIRKPMPSEGCPSYAEWVFLFFRCIRFLRPGRRYAMRFHAPASGGPLNLPFQRPIEACRKFTSHVIDSVVETVSAKVLNNTPSPPHLFYLSNFFLYTIRRWQI